MMNSLDFQELRRKKRSWSSIERMQEKDRTETRGAGFFLKIQFRVAPGSGWYDVQLRALLGFLTFLAFLVNGVLTTQCQQPQIDLLIDNQKKGSSRCEREIEREEERKTPIDQI